MIDFARGFFLEFIKFEWTVVMTTIRQMLRLGLACQAARLCRDDDVRLAASGRMRLIVVEFFKFFHQLLNLEARKDNLLSFCDDNILNKSVVAKKHCIACYWVHALLCDIASARLG